MQESIPLPTGRGFKNITGSKFNRLLVLEFAGKDKNNNRRWKCVCDCGKEVTVQGGHLSSGHTKSCGCHNRECSLSRFTKHGMTESPEFNIWTLIKGRCLHPNNKSYSDYGARGITVCERWMESFENFYADMGPRPSKEYSIERKDNNGNYCPENCKWGTRLEQANNKRNNVILTFNGETLTICQWSRLIGIGRATLAYRLKVGWTISETLMTPVRGRM